MFQVRNTGIDYYNIVSTTRASSNAFGGGTSILASYNRKFLEKLHATVPYLSLQILTVNSFVQTTNVSPIDDDVNTFTSYSQTQYEKTFLNEDVFFINQKVIASVLIKLLTT